MAHYYLQQTGIFNLTIEAYKGLRSGVCWDFHKLEIVCGKTGSVQVFWLQTSDCGDLLPLVPSHKNLDHEIQSSPWALWPI